MNHGYSPAPGTELQHSYGPELAPENYGPEVVPSTLPEHIPRTVEVDTSKQFVEKNGAYPPGAYVPYGQYQQVQSPPQSPPEAAPTRKRILGLSVLAFWGIVIAIVVLLAVGLGAGLGVGLSNNSSKSTSSTASASAALASLSSTSSIASTSTSTSSSSSSSTASSTTSSTASATPTAVTSGTTGISANSCNTSTPRTYEVSGDTKFTAFCFTDWYKGDAAADGNGTIKDIARTTVYTFEDCMEYCVSYNKVLSSGDQQCQAVTYNSNLTSIVKAQGGNCFLKDKQGKNQPGRAESASAVIAL